MEPDRPSTAGALAGGGAPSAESTAPGAPSAGNTLAGSWRLLRDPVVVTSAVACLLHLPWFRFVANSGGDVAAQDAWASDHTSRIMPSAGRHLGQLPLSSGSSRSEMELMQYRWSVGVG
ncbi:hypothetical protein V1460_11745 [Streptomyces sp. SCSIO 30461]|uniref:hypothetical protein n=1 Tax=Streptomyces sp. SCSIO 30461 TaxID=3118085 RepID=UPI0030CEE4FF